MSQPFNWGRVLVTGSGGFIGYALVHQLVTQGAQVRAFLRYTSRADSGLLRYLPAEVQDSVEMIFGDLRDADAVERAAEGVDCIFHLGALISIPYSYVHPVEVVQSNVIGTLNVLHACRHYGCRLVRTSTSEVYGTALRVPIDEDHPLQGQSPYSASKIGADHLVESYYRAFDVPAVTLRPFNTYGPGQSARAVIPTIVTQALTADTIRLGNLEVKRDFTYLDDTVDGFLRAAKTPEAIGQTIHLGSGKEISVGELVSLVLELVGREVRVVVDEERLRPEKSEVMRLLSDNSKARRVLGWEPRVGMREGLARTIDWIREHLDLFRVGRYER